MLRWKWLKLISQAIYIGPSLTNGGVALTLNTTYLFKMKKMQNGDSHDLHVVDCAKLGAVCSVHFSVVETLLCKAVLFFFFFFKVKQRFTESPLKWLDC